METVFLIASFVLGGVAGWCLHSHYIVWCYEYELEIENDELQRMLDEDDED